VHEDNTRILKARNRCNSLTRKKPRFENFNKSSSPF